MTIFGKSLSQYVSFCKLFLVLILIVGAARLAASLAGTPVSTARWLSITVVAWIGVVYYAIRVPSTGFGSYKELLPICVLQSITTQIIVVPSIILAIVTGVDNIYSVPENFFGRDGKTWLHVAGHLVLGTTVAPLISWLVGCVILFVTKKLATRSEDGRAAARA